MVRELGATLFSLFSLSLLIGWYFASKWVSFPAFVLHFFFTAWILDLHCLRRAWWNPLCVHLPQWKRRVCRIFSLWGVLRGGRQGRKRKGVCERVCGVACVVRV